MSRSEPLKRPPVSKPGPRRSARRPGFEVKATASSVAVPALEPVKFECRCVMCGWRFFCRVEGTNICGPCAWGDWWYKGWQDPDLEP